ncbi:hypothetical protein [Actinophytocola sediminis]
MALSALLLALPVSVSAAEPRADHQPLAVAGQPASDPAQPSAPAPDGPAIEQPETEAERGDTRRKLVMGIASAVLLGIVVWGRSIRRKKAKAG